jgi:hypothetical protein
MGSSKHMRQAAIVYFNEYALYSANVGLDMGVHDLKGLLQTRNLIQKKREYNLPMYMLFAGYEKVFERVLRSKLWKVTWNKGSQDRLLKVTQILQKNY